MGSTGSSTRSYTSGMSGGATTTVSPTPSNPLPITPVNAGNPGVASQAPNTQNTPVVPGALNALTAMSDSQMAALVKASKGVQMPNFLSDQKDATQEFVFQAGINEKPLVLDAKQFSQFMKDNGLTQQDVMARSVNGATYRNNDGTNVVLSAQQVNDILKTSRLNYIGGKKGGQMLGGGAYFEVTGGSKTSYGSTTMNAVLNPKTAKVITSSQLANQVRNFQRTHPLTARAIGGYSTGRGGTASIYALCMGYNVITDGRAGVKNIGGGAYVNVIDRVALVIKE